MYALGITISDEGPSFLALLASTGPGPVSKAWVPPGFSAPTLTDSFRNCHNRDCWLNEDRKHIRCGNKLRGPTKHASTWDQDRERETVNRQGRDPCPDQQINNRPRSYAHRTSYLRQPIGHSSGKHAHKANSRNSGSICLSRHRVQGFERVLIALMPPRPHCGCRSAN